MAGKPETPDRRGTAPDLTRLTEYFRGRSGAIALATTGLFVLAVFFTLWVARAFFMPVAIALLLNFLLSPLVRLLNSFRIPSSLGAFLVMAAMTGALILGAFRLAGPAGDWVERAPQTLRRVEYRLRDLRRPVEQVREATRAVEEATTPGGEEEETPEVRIVSESLMSQTRGLIVAGVTTLFLLFFLLASGDLYLEKLVRVLPFLSQKKKAVAIVRRTERELSRYFLTWALINLVLGAAVAGALYLTGLPNPLLWGAVAGLLNFIPYVGPVAGVSIVAVVSLATFDETGRALAAPAAYTVIQALEGYLVTPLVMGRRLTLNPVALFLWLIFWTWIWGIPGTLLAVPLLAVVKTVCDNVEVLWPVGEFLGR